MKLRDLFSDETKIDKQAGAIDVSGLAMDSRVVKPGDLFFALAGAKTDGARFIDAAIAAGAVAVAGEHPPQGLAVPFVTTANPRRALALAAAKFLSETARDHCRRHRHQRQDLGCGLHAPDLAAARTRLGEHRHHRAGIAEAHRLWLADHARSDRAASAARRDRARRRHASRLRSVLARARSVSPRRRARRGGRLHQSLARPHGLPSRCRALPQCQAAAVPRSRSARRRGGDLRRS